MKFTANILSRSFKLANKNNLNNYLSNPSGESVLEFILDQRWKRRLEIIPTMQNSREMY